MKCKSICAIFLGLLSIQGAFAMQGTKITGISGTSANIVSFEGTRDQPQAAGSQGSPWDVLHNPGSITFQAREQRVGTNEGRVGNCTVSSSSTLYPLAVKLVANFQKGALLKVIMQHGICTSISMQRITTDTE